MSENLKAAAFAAGLSDKERAEVDSLNKALGVHRELSNLPQNVAQRQYNKLTDTQRESLKQNFGESSPLEQPKRGWLGTAWHYSIGGVLNVAQELSDLTTRAYRAAVIPIMERKTLGFAWDEANDKGDKIFNPNRLADARRKFGGIQTEVAMKVSQRIPYSQLIKDYADNPEALKYIQLGFNKAGTPEEQDVMKDAILFVDSAKYSPGRQFANIIDAITPGELVKNGFAYKLTSGVVDAAWRIGTDPTLVVGKTKRLLDVKKYALDVVIGGNKVDEVFQSQGVVNFWNRYGAVLNKYDTAVKSNKTAEAMAARNELKAIAPEFGPATIKSFLDADIPVTNAATAKAFFQNAKQVDEVLKGQIGRRRPLMPRLDVARRARIRAVTTGNKLLNLDRVGPDLVDDMFFGAAATDDGIAEKIINNQKEIVTILKGDTPSKGVGRLSSAMIKTRIDRFKGKFTAIPFFADNIFDVTSKDASDKIYRLSRLVMPQRESKLLAQAFDNIDDVGRRKDIYYGIIGTIGEYRGITITAEGQVINRQMLGLRPPIFAADDVNGVNPSKALINGKEESIALIPSDLSPFVSAPSIRDIDRAAARTGLVQKFAGFAHKDWVEKMTSYWSFFTLAGPRYAIRNATEDLMVHLAIGESPWGLAKSRFLSTRLRTVRQVEKGLTKWEARGNDPLGLVMRLVNKNESEAYAVRLKEAMDNGGGIKEVRTIMAQAVNEGKINRFYKTVGLGKMMEADKAALAKQIIHGDLDNALMDVVEGGKQSFTGLDYTTRSLVKVRKNRVRNMELKMEYPSGIRRGKGAKGFGPMVPWVDEASRVSWMMRINYYANDNLGAIAVANLDKKEVAVPLIAKWFEEHPEIYKQFRWKNANVSLEEHAGKVYDAARQLFSKKNGDLNLELLDKVRTIGDDGAYKVSGSMTIDDLPMTEADSPRLIVGPALVAVSDSGNYTASLMEWGWDWLGEANARLSREPMVLAEMIKLRKQFEKSGFEQAFIKAHLRGVDATDAKKVEQATNLAQRKLSEIVEDRARLQTLAYVDNPMVQSQFAFSIRNFARFYRATEDFYRRLYRVTRYNPEAFRKIALTYEGITHSGWVVKDDQGEPYFIYPGLEPVYKAVQFAMQGLGVDAEFKTPLPVQFGADLRMITPSANPESLIPTFAGPLAGVSMKFLANVVNIWSPGAADTVERITLGKYAVDQPMLSAFLPAHVNRIYGAMNRDERDGQYASAWRKAVTYLEAGGHGIPKRYDEDNNLIPPTAAELEAYRVRVKNTTIGILGLRAVLGFFAPASPQTQLKSDINQWVRQSGEANFKQVWYGLLDQYAGDYDAAMTKWVELFPDQMPFTISESERKTVAYFRYADESGKFVDENSDLFKRYPQGAAFLIPHKSGFSWDAYKTMTDMGLRQNKRVDEHLREVQTAADLQTYFDRRDKYEADLENVGTDYERSLLRKDFNEWKTSFFAGRPLVQEELAQGSQKAIDRLNALNDLEAMLGDKSVRVKPQLRSILSEMLQTYKDYKSEKDLFQNFPGGSVLQDAAKEQAVVKIRKLAEYNENTQSAYNLLFARLLGE